MARSITSLVPTAGLELAPFGILSPAVAQYDENEDFWTSGFTYEVEDAGVIVANGIFFGADQTDPTNVIDNSANTERFKKYYPFDIRASIKVSTFGTTPSEIEASAKRALDIATQKAVEIEFWNGDVAQLLTSDDNDNRYLASTQSVDVTPTAGTAVKVRYGLAILEEAIASSSVGAKGVIHATRDVATALRLKSDGDVLRTNLETPVVAGVGYSKKGPTGADAPAGKAWMYATGPISVRLGPTKIVPEKLNQAINLGINEIEYHADRPAAVTWASSTSYAVLVDLTLDYA